MSNPSSSSSLHGQKRARSNNDGDAMSEDGKEDMQPHAASANDATPRLFLMDGLRAGYLAIITAAVSLFVNDYKDFHKKQSAVARIQQTLDTGPSAIVATLKVNCKLNLPPETGQGIIDEFEQAKKQFARQASEMLLRGRKLDLENHPEPTYAAYTLKAKMKLNEHLTASGETNMFDSTIVQLHADFEKECKTRLRVARMKYFAAKTANSAKAKAKAEAAEEAKAAALRSPQESTQVYIDKKFNELKKSFRQPSQKSQGAKGSSKKPNTSDNKGNKSNNKGNKSNNKPNNKHNSNKTKTQTKTKPSTTTKKRK